MSGDKKDGKQSKEERERRRAEKAEKAQAKVERKAAKEEKRGRKGKKEDASEAERAVHDLDGDSALVGTMGEGPEKGSTPREDEVGAVVEAQGGEKDGGHGEASGDEEVLPVWEQTPSVGYKRSTSKGRTQHKPKRGKSLRTVDAGRMPAGFEALQALRLMELATPASAPLNTAWTELRGAGEAVEPFQRKLLAGNAAFHHACAELRRVGDSLPPSQCKRLASNAAFHRACAELRRAGDSLPPSQRKRLPSDAALRAAWRELCGAGESVSPSEHRQARNEPENGRQKGMAPVSSLQLNNKGPQLWTKAAPVESGASASRRSSALSVSTSLTGVGSEEVGGVMEWQCRAASAMAVVEGGAGDGALPPLDQASHCKPVEPMEGSAACGVTGGGSVEAAAMGAGVDTQVPPPTASASNSSPKLVTFCEAGLEALGTHISRVFQSTTGLMQEVGLAAMTACRSGMAQAAATTSWCGCVGSRVCERACQVMAGAGRWMYGLGVSAYSRGCAVAVSLWARVW